MAAQQGPANDPNPFMARLNQKRSAAGQAPIVPSKKKKKNSKGKQDAIARRLAAMRKG